MALSYSLIAATPECPAHVHVGVGPGGVTWNVYLKPSESLEDLTERVRQTQDNFRRRCEKAAAKPETVRVSKLTESGLHLILDQASCVEDYADDYKQAKIGKSYIETSRRLLEAVLDRLADAAEDAADMARCGDAVSEEEQEFAYRSVLRSGMIARKRVVLALAGKKQPNKIRV